MTPSLGKGTRNPINKLIEMLTLYANNILPIYTNRKKVTSISSNDKYIYFEEIAILWPHQDDVQKTIPISKMPK